MRTASGILALALVLAFTGGLAAAELIHNPVLSGPADEDLDVQAALVGAPTGNVQVRLYYRARGVEIYRSVPMGGPAAALTATIPGSAVDVAGLEYYIEADVMNGSSKQVLATAPAAGNPALNPYEVAVRRDDSAPQITVLSPGDGSSVDSSTPVLSASYYSADGVIDPSSVVLKIDGGAVKGGGLQVSDSVVSYAVSAPLTDGSHTVQVSVATKAGHSASISWSFQVGAGAVQTLHQSHWLTDGKFWAETQYGALVVPPAQATGNLPYLQNGSNAADVEANLRGEDDTFSLKAYVTDQERGDAQPVDRFLATWNNREGTISLGDVSPSFSELSIQNLYELRGIDFDLLSGRTDANHTRLIGLWGQTEWAVNSSGALPNGATASPTYAQYLYGVRWEAGGRDFLIGFNSVTVNDDEDSLSGASVLPQYNTLETVDAHIGVPAAWLKFNGEVGVDIFAGDPSVLGFSAASAYLAGLDWDARPWGSKFDFEWKDLGGEFGYLPGGYVSIANPGLQPDYRGFESSFNQKLLAGRLDLSLAENNWRNNLQGQLPTTTWTNFFSAQSTVAPRPDLPYVNLGYTQTNLWNDGSLGFDAEGNTLSVYTNQLTEAANLAVGYTRAIGAKGTGSLNLSYTGTFMTDMAPLRSVQNNQGWNLVMAAFYGRGDAGFNGTLGLGGSSDPAAMQAGGTAEAAFLPASNSDTYTGGLHWTEKWRGTPFNSSLGWDIVEYLSSTDAGADDGLGDGGVLAAQVNNSKRNTFGIGGGWTVDKRQKVNLQMDYAFVSSTLDAGEGGGAQTESFQEFFLDLRYDLTF